MRRIAPPIAIKMFDNSALAGVEIFYAAKAIIETAADTCPIAADQGVMALQIRSHIAQGDTARKEINEIIRKTAVPRFLHFAVTEAGRFRNNWLAALTVGNYGEH